MKKTHRSHMRNGEVTRGLRGCVLAACVIAMGAALDATRSGAAAQSAKPGDELRTLYANSADIAEGKRLAQTICAPCHGADGVSQREGVPHLAGQRAPYLYLELRAYQSGLRGATPMRNTVGVLNDDALVKVASYFASLDPASGIPPTTATAAEVDPVKDGEAAAASCAGCHGDGGVTKTAGFPSLVGLDPKYLVASMKAYRSGQRKSDLMAAMVANVADAAINDIALYYALQKAAPAQSPAAGDRAAGQAAATPCAGCHGDTGVSGNPDIPSLAGQDATYLATAMLAYRQGVRSDETMKGMVAALDEVAIKNLAAYYAAQEPKPPANVRRPLTAGEWAQRCDRCHGVNGNSTDPRLPALAGQRFDYLDAVLKDYRGRARKNPQMAAMSDVLSDGDIKNLAAHYSRQKAKAVMFIAIPGK
jgi:cytochrome c553